MVHFFVYVVGGGLAVTFFLISLAAMVAVLDIAVALRRISRTLERIELAFAEPPYDRPQRTNHHINMRDNAPATIGTRTARICDPLRILRAIQTLC